MPGDALSIVQRLSAVFDRLGIPYYIGGSVASISYGEIRATNDVDFVAQMLLPQAQELARMLGEDWYSDSDMIAEAIRDKSSFNVIDFQTMLKADVFIPKDDPFSREQFKRRRYLALTDNPENEDPVEAYVASAEDIVLQKLRWYRMGGEVSDRQWRDIMGVLIYQAGRLDEIYLDHWAAEIGVADLLQKVRTDSERPWNPR